MIIQCIRGVALIIKNPGEEILILQEYETKPCFGKYAGMFSIPMETSKSGESDHRALFRLIQEELPGFEPVFKEAAQSRIGIYRIVPHVWVTLYSAKAMDHYLPSPKGREVGSYQWIDPRKALNLWLRQGAREMINDFMKGKKEVFCRQCRAVEKCKR